MMGQYASGYEGMIVVKDAGRFSPSSEVVLFTLEALTKSTTRSCLVNLRIACTAT